MIPKLLRELIMNAEREKVARDFWDEIERLAAEKEVTIDYYLAEFY
jgi:predicted DNA-binding ribbon-helix-helix protein